jgi:four helix bundle protein
MKNNVILDKSYAFALRIIKLCRHLQHEKQEFILSKQIMRSGTSIGANIEEAEGGYSRREFIAKLQISYKEIRETHYWLRLLRDSGILEDKLAKSFLTDCEELKRIIVSILKSIKENG